VRRRNVLDEAGRHDRACGPPSGVCSQWAESGIRGERRGFVPCQPQEIALASVTKRTMRRSKEERRQQMREQLLRGVEGMLAEGGRCTDLLIDRIVAAAGVGRSNFYVYSQD
jgi:hypothetical protein